MRRRVVREVSSEAEEVQGITSIIQVHTIEAEVVEAMEGMEGVEGEGYQGPVVCGMDIRVVPAWIWETDNPTMEVQEGHPQLVQDQATVDRLVRAEAVEVAEDGEPSEVQGAQAMRIKPMADITTEEVEAVEGTTEVAEGTEDVRIIITRPHPSTLIYWQEVAKDTVQVEQGIFTEEEAEDTGPRRSRRPRETNLIREQVLFRTSMVAERARTE